MAGEPLSGVTSIWGNFCPGWFNDAGTFADPAKIVGELLYGIQNYKIPFIINILTFISTLRIIAQ